MVGVRVASCLVYCLKLIHQCLAQDVDFALVDEREKNKIRKESDELGALILKLQLDDDETSMETYIQMEGEEITKLDLSIDELVDASSGTIT